MGLWYYDFLLDRNLELAWCHVLRDTWLVFPGCWVYCFFGCWERIFGLERTKNEEKSILERDC